MNGILRFARAGGSTLVVVALAMGATTALAGQPHERYRGRPLADALRTLQASGLRIVFTSTIVPPDLRVSVEPSARSARQQLDELLAPHGLAVEEGPGRVLQVVRARPTTTAPPRRASPVTTRSFAPGLHAEHVTVNGLQQADSGVPSQLRLTRTAIEQMQSIVADDAMRLVHALPGVSAADDFRSEFSVRGSPHRHVEVVVDGVATPWLRHAAHGRGTTGSVAMIGSQALEQVTLRAGAYPHRHGDRLGPELELALREGSRARPQWSGSLGGTHATVVGEGPIGRSERGSWLLTVRRSYLDWPIEREAPEATVFGFSDAVAKLVYDVRPGQQVSLSLVGGLSSLDEDDDRPPGEFGDGVNRAAVVNLAWRSTVSRRLVISQRAHVVAHDFFNKYQGGRDADRGANQEVGYRVDLARAVVGGVFEAGAQLRRIHGSRHIASSDEPDDPRSAKLRPLQPGATSVLGSGFLQLKWSPVPGVTLTPGVRVIDSSLVRDRALTRWVLGEWSFSPAWTLKASTGVAYQFPEVQHALALGDPSGLRAERAAYLDVGIEQRLGESVRWQATLFRREERNILRDPDIYARLDGSRLVLPTGIADSAHVLAGSSRGVDLLVERRGASGLTGWLAYSFGRARYTDLERRESFWANDDQRHVLNAFGRYPLSHRASVSATFRAGTNVPIPGYLAAGTGGVFVGTDRNRVRLPPYARLDVRGDRTFDVRGRRLTLFLEVLNALNRTNLGLANGSIRPETGEAVGFTSARLPRLVSGGLEVAF
jgi:hypothetical protein